MGTVQRYRSRYRDGGGSGSDRSGAAGRHRCRNGASLLPPATRYWCSGVGTNPPTPLFYAARFGFSTLTITLIVAVYAALIVPMLPLAGPLADAPRWVPML